MLGNNLFRVQSNSDFNSSQYKALILLYKPLIGNDALYLYQFLSVKGTYTAFEEINKLLNSLMISIDSFEEYVHKLNEYKLVRTLKNTNDETYVFVIENPLSFEEFVKDDLFVRDFILKTSGLYYQSLLNEIEFQSDFKNYKDVSAKFNKENLAAWNNDNESFLKNKKKPEYNFNTFFDINIFLKDVSTRILPMKYRTVELLSEIARLADLYNISYEKMRKIIAQIPLNKDISVYLEQLKNKCMYDKNEFKQYNDGIYNIPCELFLMNKQEGKEATPYDKKIIYNLSYDYNLKPEVINVILEHGLTNCNNSLIENYIYPIASDLHRNNIETSKQALERLSKEHKVKNIKETLETYDSSNNPSISAERKEELRRRRKNEK